MMISETLTVAYVFLGFGAAAVFVRRISMRFDTCHVLTPKLSMRP